MATPPTALLQLARGKGLPSNTRLTISLVRSAVEHGLGPLLDEAVRRDSVDADTDALTLLAMDCLENTAHTGACDQALRVLLTTSESLEIDVALFKGAAIGQRWYSRPELRPSNDIDIFLSPDQVNRIGDIVGEFNSLPETSSMISALVADGATFEHTVSIAGVPVDIHRDPINLVISPLDIHRIWAHTEVLTLERDREIRVLDLEASTVQMLVNVFRDGFATLRHIHDLRVMLDQNPDWDSIAEWAAAEGWSDLVRLSLDYVCKVLHRPSPLAGTPSVLNLSLATAIWPSRLRLSGTESLHSSAYRQLLIGFIVVGRRRQTVRAILRRFFPPQVLIRHRLAVFSPDDSEANRHVNRSDHAWSAAMIPQRITSAISYGVTLYKWRRIQYTHIRGRREPTQLGSEWT